MKRFLPSMMVSAVLAVAGAAAPAAAADLTVRFEGRFESGTCAISVPDVDLGRHPAAFFDSATSTGLVVFQVERKSCTSDIRQIQMRFDGSADTRNANYFAVPATGGVTGVAVQVIDSNATTMVPNTRTLTLAVDPDVSLLTAFRARLMRVTPVVTPGRFSVPLMLNVVYN